MDTIADRKRAMRRAVRAGIAAMDPAERARQEALLRARVPALPGWAGAGVVLLYVSAFAEEVDTRPLLLDVLGRGLRLVLPRVDRDAGRLALHEVGDLGGGLIRGIKGIPEPSRDLPAADPREVDWALVPGLAFDASGHRLGRGAGHYDRLLPGLRPETPRWALALGPQCVEAVPVEPHDVPLDGVVRAVEDDRSPRRHGGDGARSDIHNQ